MCYFQTTNKDVKSVNYVNSINISQNSLKTKFDLLNIHRFSNITYFNNNTINSRSYSKPRNNTTIKANVRKLLLINTPNHNEIKKNEKLALHSISKVINNSILQENNKNKNVSSLKNIKIASLFLNNSYQSTIKIAIKNLNKDKNVKIAYLGENFNDIEDSEFIITKFSNSESIINSKDIKFLYISLINQNLISVKSTDCILPKKIINYNYFLDSLDKQKFLSLESYTIKFQIDFDLINKMINDDRSVLKGYKLFFHPTVFLLESFNCNENSRKDNIKNIDNHKKEIFNKIIILLGGSVVNNIRLCDLCIINKIENNQHFPPHVINLNEEFLIECIYNLKMPEMEKFKYKPKDTKIKKIRK